MEFLPTAFSALASYKQFIIYKVVPSKTRPGKNDKIPIDPLFETNINAQNSHFWMTAQEALTTYALLNGNYGIGFVLTSQDPFWFLDIDNCFDTTTQKWSQHALYLKHYFKDAAIEISNSKKGLHIIGSGAAPEHACNPSHHSLEFYTEKRFIALTGINALGNAGLDFTEKLPWIIDNYFPPTKTFNEKTWTTEPHINWRGNKDDAELIRRALKSQSSAGVFGERATFKDLWERNVEKLAIAFPADINSLNNFNESAADASLAQHLAFWTGNNCERILELMQQSQLVRSKWDREDYLTITILNAIAKQTEFLQDKPAETFIPVNTDLNKIKLVTGNTFLNIEEQLELFKGCVYVRDEHKVLVPDGDLLKPEQFRATYGGFTFMLDTVNQKTTRNAWEAYTESQAFRKMWSNSTCFRPDLPAGEILEVEGRRLVNIWQPINTIKIKGDPTLFLNHLKKLIPDTRDREILLSYMAACVQYPGIKFQWAPLIQGVEGNGKTLLSLCISYAIGIRYSHFPRSDQLDEKYNDWLYKTLFIGIEEVYAPDLPKNLIEILKTCITSKRLEIRGMHSNKVMRDVCCNFMINTNHKDGLKKTNNDRRYAPFYTPQQDKDDLIRDGLCGDYFPKLYQWFEKENGFAIVNDFLQDYKINPEFNPAHKNSAPLTTSTEEALVSGLGFIEQEIMESIEQGISGFCGGWVSSMALDKLLDRLNVSRRVPHNKRRDLLKALGYDWHPGLNKGRVNNSVLPDGGKPRLYILKNHPALFIDSAAEIANLYTEAQKSS